MPLPPGVSERDFASALEEFRRVVGDAWVFSSDADLDLYRDAYSPLRGEDEDPVPSAAVAPKATEQVQEVVRIANRYKVPLWTISTGKNLGYGGAAPCLSGTVMLDVKRMNRILEVDEKNHYALVEPGVSYFDLYRYIHERRLKVWIDTPDPGWGSLIGNALERGGGYTPMRDHFDAHCGMEVVLPNGDLLRTGMGALPNSKTWQQYRYGFGPYLDGIFSQSSLGVVTKMGFWLYPQPEAQRSGTVSVPRRRDLVPLMEHVNYLMNSYIAQGTIRIQSALSSFGPSDPGLAALRARPGGATVEDVERHFAGRGQPYWSVALPFYGPPNVIAAQWEYAKERLGAAIPGARFQDGPEYRFPLTEEQIARITNGVSLGIPSLQAFSYGAGTTRGHLWFAPIVPMTGEAIIEAQEVLMTSLAELGVPLTALIPPQSYFPRSVVVFVGFPITADVATNRRTRDTYRTLVKTAQEHGWGEYRTHIQFMDDVMESYSFNDHALRRFHEQLKDAIDPNGILAPGKNGIWPARLRPGRA